MALESALELRQFSDIMSVYSWHHNAKKIDALIYIIMSYILLCYFYKPQAKPCTKSTGNC